MILLCSAREGWRLVEPDDFRRFKLVLQGLGPSDAPSADGVELGRDGQAWIGQDFLIRLAGAGATEAWRADLERMVAFAAKHGWVREDGFIRAHVEATA